MKRSRISIIVSIAFLLGFSACNNHQKVLKSNDPEFKLEKAREYYQEEDFMKAIPVLEDLITMYRGTNKAEDVYYYYAYCYYGKEDYLMASHYFQQFVRTYPNSDRAQECAFMSAYCDYQNSPQWSLDQSETRRAIHKMQLFINKYPNSSRIDSCNQLIDELRSKLEKKSFEKAWLYYHTEHYRAAMEAFDNTLEQYPGIPNKEEIYFLKLESHFNLAIKSIESKKKRRLEDTVKSYRKFEEKFPESERMKDAKKILEKTRKALEEHKEQTEESS